MSKELELIAEHHISQWSKSVAAPYAICWCGEQFASVELHAAHVVEMLSEHGYSIVQRDRLARSMYLDQARRFVHSDDSMTPDQSWDEGFFERKSLWLAQADRLLAAAAAAAAAEEEKP